MKKQYGMSLMEVMIVIAVATVLTAYFMEGFAPLLKASSRQETEFGLSELKSAFELAYTENYANIIKYGDATRRLHLSATTGINQIGCEDTITQNSTALGNMLLPLESYLPRGSLASAKDGFGQPYCLAVSPLLYRQYGNAILYYHNIAIISRGENGTLDALTPGTTATENNINSIFMPNSANVFNAAYGAVNTSYVLRNIFSTAADASETDDTAVFIDGYPLALKLYKKTQEKLDKASKAYETYFNVRYLMEPTRNISYDYFYYDQHNATDGARADQSSSGAVFRTHATDTSLTGAYAPYTGVLSSSYSAVRMASDSSGTGLLTGNTLFLGLRSEDFRDASGNSLYFDNSSSKVRSVSSNTFASEQFPPYTALFLAKLSAPDGATSTTVTEQYLTATAVGNY